MDELPVEITVDTGARIPEYKTAQAAGADLYASIAEPCVLEPGERKAVPTGIRIALPMGFEAQVRPRSGLALEKGITCLNAPGTIDADYRGEIQVILINHGTETVVIEPMSRIAQLVVAPVARVSFKPVSSLDKTGRGNGGFGSTGL